jgi:Cof subfamily protein (haloacid dehalogenase superfamily)
MPVKALMTNQIKLIAIDLDGTLLNSHHHVSEKTAQTLRRAVEAGVQVVIATGRPYRTCVRHIRELGLQTPGVFMQGLAIHNADGSTRYERSMEPETARRLLNFGYEHALDTMVYNSQSIYTRKRNEATDFMLRYGEPPPEEIPALADLADQVPISKVLFLMPPTNIPALRAQLTPLVNGAVNLVTSQAHMLECLPPGASKGAGLARLLEDEGVLPAQVLAIGDGENDIEMLQLAGISVAMGNANAHLQTVAQHITLSNDEDGVAHAVERFVLNAQPRL